MDHKKVVDPVLEIQNARNNILGVALLAEEYAALDFIELGQLYSAIESINAIQRWFIQHPHELEHSIF